MRDYAGIVHHLTSFGSDHIIGNNIHIKKILEWGMTVNIISTK